MKNLSALKDLAISENGFVFDPFSGGTFIINATGLTIVNGLRDGMTQGQIARRLREEFDEAGENVDEDVREFLNVLNANGWLSDSRIAR